MDLSLNVSLGQRHEGEEGLVYADRLLHRLGAVLDLLSVGAQHAEHAELTRGVISQQLADSDRVVKRLGHLVFVTLEVEVA